MYFSRRYLLRWNTVGEPTSHGKGSQRNVRDNVTNITTSEMLALVLWRTIWPSFKSLRS
jgi:hypothetical protein